MSGRRSRPLIPLFPIEGDERGYSQAVTAFVCLVLGPVG